MEEKDVNSIASAVTTALSKLNADAAKKDADQKDSGDKIPIDPNDQRTEIFRCPECDTVVKGGIAYCQGCGCALEWED